VLLVAAVAGCERASSLESKDSEADGKEKPLTVRAEPAQRRTIDQFVYGLGRCEPLPEKLAAITTAVEGRVLKILAGPGDAVKAGQPILELDPTIARANLDEKTARRWKPRCASCARCLARKSGNRSNWRSIRPRPGSKRRIRPSGGFAR